jgi:hypothetical protein
MAGPPLPLPPWQVWNTQHRPADVRASCQQSLADLGCAYLDLLLVHWPEAWLAGSTAQDPKPDTEATIHQTWWAALHLLHPLHLAAAQARRLRAPPPSPAAARRSHFGKLIEAAGAVRGRRALRQQPLAHG